MSDNICNKSAYDRKVLVIGDWVVDDTWLIGRHRTKIATNVGLRHYRSLHRPENVVRRLSGAGHVATLIHSAYGGVRRDEGKFSSDEGQHAKSSKDLEKYEVVGLGLWNPVDTLYLCELFYPNRVAGRTPYRVTHYPPQEEDTEGVRLHSIEQLIDDGSFKYIDKPGLDPQLATRGRDQFFGTTRVYRFYQQSGTEPEQMSRIDWELPPPLKQHGVQAWVNEKNSQQPKFEESVDELVRQFGKVDAVVIKDIGKGVVSQALLEAILNSSSKIGVSLSEKPWFVSTRYWEPEWLKKLSTKVDIRLIFYSEVSTRQVANVPTWITNSGKTPNSRKMTKEAIEALQSTAQLLKKESGGLVVVNTSKLQLICLDVKHNENTAFVQPNPNPNDANLGLDIGRASMIFGTLVFGMMQSNEHGGTVIKPISVEDLLEGALAVAETRATEELRRLQEAPISSALPEQIGIGVAGPDPFAKKGYRIAKRPGGGQPEELPSVGEITGIPADRAIQDWKSSMSELGVIKQGNVDTIQGWRATAELQEYICCDPEKRKQISKFRNAVSSFEPKRNPGQQRLSALLVSPPGAGKSFFVECLAKTLGGLRVLSFNITTMTRREDLLSCFDQIVTIQSQYRDEKILVFFDEVNALLETQSVYDAFLAPLEDGYYLRSGIKFMISPCIWLFASTDDKKTIQRDIKGSDFVSRLTFGVIDFFEPHPENVQWKHVENIYLGVSLARRKYPDLRCVQRRVLTVLSQLPADTSNREIRRFIDKHFISVDGQGDWDDVDSVLNDEKFEQFKQERRNSLNNSLHQEDQSDNFVYLRDY